MTNEKQLSEVVRTISTKVIGSHCDDQIAQIPNSKGEPIMKSTLEPITQTNGDFVMKIAPAVSNVVGDNSLTRNFEALKPLITGMVLDLTRPLFCVPDAYKSEHRWICPVCGEVDCFDFRRSDGTFHCQKCKFKGDLITLVGKIQNVEPEEAFQIIGEASSALIDQVFDFVKTTLDWDDSDYEDFDDEEDDDDFEEGFYYDEEGHSCYIAREDSDSEMARALRELLQAIESQVGSDDGDIDSVQ